MALHPPPALRPDEVPDFKRRAVQQQGRSRIGFLGIVFVTFLGIGTLVGGALVLLAWLVGVLT